MRAVRLMVPAVVTASTRTVTSSLRGSFDVGVIANDAGSSSPASAFKRPASDRGVRCHVCALRTVDEIVVLPRSTHTASVIG